MSFDAAPNSPCIRNLCRCAVLLLATVIASCATVSPPRPWEKGTLARPEMQLDAGTLGNKLDQHIYTSKEAAAGGYGAGGGGCGCN
jgi:hypothetical protein